MFEVKKQEYTNKTFRIPSELVGDMQRLAQEKGVSLNSLVIQCCKYALDNMSGEEKDNNG